MKMKIKIQPKQEKTKKFVRLETTKGDVLIIPFSTIDKLERLNGKTIARCRSFETR